MSNDARRAAETAARVAYGRLLAMLVSWSRDIAGAEDALSEAFASALRTWPQQGVPNNPEAWLLTSARNQFRNAHRHRGVQASAPASARSSMRRSISACAEACTPR